MDLTCPRCDVWFAEVGPWLQHMQNHEEEDLNSPPRSRLSSIIGCTLALIVFVPVGIFIISMLAGFGIRIIKGEIGIGEIIWEIIGLIIVGVFLQARNSAYRSIWRKLKK